MSRLPFNVAGNSLTFYVKGRPYHLHKDHQNFDTARRHLLAPNADHDAEMLIELVDVRKGLERASFGAIQFDGNDILWRGKPLTGIWVDRILAYRAAGEAFDHLWKALDKLVHNPTATAIERLPIFLDRVGLGFLPDGRFLAFKGVQADYLSAHENKDGTRFRHLVGDKPRMAREEVDPDPNETCSTGLHVGAPGYVRGHYSGGKFALVLVAVDPVDVVSVPTDYHGEKMRVCGYEVIDHLDQTYSDELFGRLRAMTAVPTPAPAPAPEPDARLASLACVGDVVHYAGHDSDGHSGMVRAGLYEVLEVDETNDGKRLKVATAWDQVWLRDDKITRLVRDGVEVRPVDGVEPEDEGEDLDDVSDYDRLKTGDVVEYQDAYDADLWGWVVTAAFDGSVEIRDLEGDIVDLSEDDFGSLLAEEEITAAMVVTKGALVRIEGHDFLQEGDYTIAGINEEEDGSNSLQNEPDGEFWAVLANGRRLPIRNRNIVVASLNGEHLWPRTSISTSTITVADEVDAYTKAVITTPKIKLDPERAEPGDLVQTKQEGGWLPAGTYPVLVVFDWGYEVQTQFDGIQPVSNDRVVSVTRVEPQA